MNLPSGFSGDAPSCCLLTVEERDSDHEMQSEKYFHVLNTWNIYIRECSRHQDGPVLAAKLARDHTPQNEDIVGKKECTK